MTQTSPTGTHQSGSRLPILILLAAQLVIGLFTFRDYGLSWDEPLFYEYGDALGYAYTPANWFDPSFDLSNAYGPSGDDHKTRGPAYLLLAREPVHLLESLGADEASAWHLVNFLTFLLGVYFVYRLSLASRQLPHVSARRVFRLPPQPALDERVDGLRRGGVVFDATASVGTCLHQSERYTVPCFLHGRISLRL